MDTQANINELFDKIQNYPDCDAKERLDNLVGLDEYKNRLSKILGLLVNPEGFESWLNKYHPKASRISDMVLRRPPLVVLEGDVGSGKSSLAESVGDMVARQQNINISLFPLSLSSRGQGRVGEMTQLISTAFAYIVSEAEKLKSNNGSSRGGIILLVDEADALAQSRENAQMHHEDRAGVNALIRGIDNITNKKLPAVVIMCTNRINALDPAIKRRSADILSFARPNEEQRLAVLSKTLKELDFVDQDVKSLVDLTGCTSEHRYGFTFSDITQRLIPAIVMDSYPDRAIKADRALIVAKKIKPTPPFQEQIL